VGQVFNLPAAQEDGRFQTCPTNNTLNYRRGAGLARGTRAAGIQPLSDPAARHDCQHSIPANQKSCPLCRRPASPHRYHHEAWRHQPRIESITRLVSMSPVKPNARSIFTDASGVFCFACWDADFRPQVTPVSPSLPCHLPAPGRSTSWPGQSVRCGGRPSRL
jgi:hypothetical protein